MPSLGRRVGSIAVVCAVVVVITFGALRYRERLQLALNPSALAAYDAGMHHFDSMNAASYDIKEAEYFLKRAAALDTHYPFVHHQLARVYFLQGKYPEALGEISKETPTGSDSDRASVYYMKGLIEGYLDQFDAAVRDYAEAVRLVPERWEARVDYAWVLIKAHRLSEAERTVHEGLVLHPDNPWLLSMRATILYEQGNVKEALVAAQRAQEAVNTITPEMWLHAYPGNAPEAAAIGIKTLRDAAQKNLELIERAQVQK